MTPILSVLPILDLTCAVISIVKTMVREDQNGWFSTILGTTEIISRRTISTPELSTVENWNVLDMHGEPAGLASLGDHVLGMISQVISPCL